MRSPAKQIASAIMLFMAAFSHSSVAQDLTEINNGILIMQPKVSFDGQKMVFVANYLGAPRPYMSTLNIDSNRWEKPTPIFSSDITSKYDIQYPQLNFDNTKIYFSAKEVSGADYNIYYSSFNGKTWSEPEEVPMGINTDVDELAPAVSADEKKILFARPYPPEAKADEDCNIIFISELQETGVWSEAEPLPPSYNTGCLCVPYFSKDNKTFFYSSKEEVTGSDGRRISKNQFNIYWAKIDGFFKYNPKPIMKLVGEEDRVSFSINPDSTVYFGSGDIFNKNLEKRTSKVVAQTIQSEFHPSTTDMISGQVVDQNGQALEAVVQVINPFTTKVFQEVKSSQGRYQVFVPSGQQYSVLAKKDGFSTQSKLVETKGENIQFDFDLFPEVDVTFNVFDQEYYFPIVANISLFDSEFNEISLDASTTLSGTSIPLGKELNIIFTSGNYFPDTLNLPFDKEVIFDFFDFDIELVRKIKDVDFTFTDEETGNNLGLEIIVYNVTRNEKTKREVKDGKITLQLRDGEVYEISTSAQGYSYYTAELDLSKDDPQEVTAGLKSVQDIAIVLNNITFEYNSYTLNAGSYEELNRLVTYLSQNDQYNVEISAHTDNSGADAYNLKLSNLRANAVLQYLQDNSINKERMIARGYGETQPIHPNDSEENMAKNRRVEFKILDVEAE